MSSWRPQRTTQERLGRAVQSMIPGTQQGRVAQAMPVRDRRVMRFSDPDEAEDLAVAQVKFDDYTHTVEQVGDQIFTLPHEPVDGLSEHVYWHPGGGAGVYQPGTEWSRSKRTMTVPDPDGFLEIGDLLVVEYAYRDGPPLLPVTPVLAGSTYREQVSTSEWVTQMPFPEGTREGDLVLLVGNGDTFCAVSDPRMSPIEQQPLNGMPIGLWGGYASDLATPIACNFKSDSVFNWPNVLLSVWRAEDGPLLFDSSAVAVIRNQSSTDGLIPGLTQEVSGAIIAYFSKGGIGGTYADQDMSKAAPYAYKVGGSSAYVAVRMLLTTADPVPAVTTPNTDPNDKWTAVVVGFQRV